MDHPHFFLRIWWHSDFFSLLLLVTLFCVKSRLWLLGIPTNWAWVVSLFLCNCLWSVCFVSSSPLYPILNNVLQMDTIRTSNKGYSAELFVVTFNHLKESMDNGSKVHILLVRFQLRFLHSFPQIYASLEKLLSILIQYLRNKYECSIKIFSTISVHLCWEGARQWHKRKKKANKHKSFH